MHDLPVITLRKCTSSSEQRALFDCSHCLNAGALSKQSRMGGLFIGAATTVQPAWYATATSKTQITPKRSLGIPYSGLHCAFSSGLRMVAPWASFFHSNATSSAASPRTETK